MKKIGFLIAACCLVLFFADCSKKAHPSDTPTATTVKPKVKKPVVPLPKTISVSDSTAHKTFDGRYYYDLMGHRYWRNNKDGKYYIYGKYMNTDPAFKKP